MLSLYKKSKPLIREMLEVPTKWAVHCFQSGGGLQLFWFPANVGKTHKCGYWKTQVYLCPRKPSPLPQASLPSSKHH